MFKLKKKRMLLWLLMILKSLPPALEFLFGSNTVAGPFYFTLILIFHRCTLENVHTLAKYVQDHFRIQQL